MINQMISEAGKVILGKDHQLRLSLSCLLAQGNLLIEDMPGMGKTTLTQVLAKVLGLSFNRIQFTSDLLPTDILGISVYEKSSEAFSFKPGPIFSQLVLADEINRASPKTQSALLEAMEEGQVTVDGETRHLPRPFFVIATQNPSSQMGTFPLPESQLDRFLMRIHLGYPDAQAEKALMLGRDTREQIKELQVVISPEELSDLQVQVKQVFVSDAVIAYVQRIVDYTRTRPGFVRGVSPRGSVAIVRSAQAWALIDNRQHLLPEDIQAVLPAVLEHRIMDSVSDDHHGSEILLSNVPVLA